MDVNVEVKNKYSIKPNYLFDVVKIILSFVMPGESIIFIVEELKANHNPAQLR